MEAFCKTQLGYCATSFNVQSLNFGRALTGFDYKCKSTSRFKSKNFFDLKTKMSRTNSISRIKRLIRNGESRLLPRREGGIRTKAVI